MTRVLGLVCAIASLAGCEFTIPSGRFACDQSADCPPGQACRAGVCMLAEATMDGGPMDAATHDAASNDPDASHDAAPPIDGEVPACDVLAQAGCDAGEKCAFVTEDGMPVSRCVPAGTAVEGGACTLPSDSGLPYDECVGGLGCAGERCLRFCTRDADACGAGYVCSQYANLPEGIGLCNELCDPVSQRRAADGAAACGSATPTEPELACYGFGPFICAPVADEARELMHNDEGHGPMSGGVFLNGCAPGFNPLWPTETRALCIAFCRPATTHDGATAGAGGVPGSGYTCADRGAPQAECRFFHFVQSGDDPRYRAYTDVGFCVDYMTRTYDHDVDPGTPEVPLPSCMTLSQEDTNGDGVADHLAHGCAP